MPFTAKKKITRARKSWIANKGSTFANKSLTQLNDLKENTEKFNTLSDENQTKVNNEITHVTNYINSL
jgi:hypothetical protein